MIGKLIWFFEQSYSRKLQYLSMLRARAVTSLFYRWRLKQCGRGSVVQRPLFWTPECISIGDDVLVWKGCRIEGVNRYGNTELQPHIQIGNRVSFQQNCHLVAADSISIGDDTTISFNVLVTDNDHQYTQPDLNILKQPLSVMRTRIGKNCFIGAGAKIQAGTDLGNQCIVGANAVVRGTFPDYCVIVGAPCRIVKRFDSITGEWRKTNSLGDFINE